MSRKSYPNVNAANQYARDVVRGKIVACQFVIQACQRHLDDLMAEKSKSFRYRFDKDLAERAAKFIQLLPHTKGEWAFKRMPITLEPWQLFVICCAFGWVNKGTRLRRFREVYTEIPRKNGKSAISAGVALYCFACDNEFGAEVYSGATTEKQAWEVFRPARLMCKRTPMLTEAFGIEVNASNMNRPEDGARFEPLIGNPGDGSSPHCAVVDEYHEHATDALYTTMLTGMGARRQPLMWAITTAGYNIEGPCYDKRREVIEMLNGSVPNDELFGIIYTVDEGDDWTDPQVLEKANPNIGVSVYREFLLSQQQRAKNNARLANVFKTKHLNIWVSARSAYFNLVSWQSCEDKSLTLEQFEGQPCILAFDLARKLDMNSMARLYTREIDGKTHYYSVAPRFWVVPLPRQRRQAIPRRRQRRLRQTPGLLKRQRDRAPRLRQAQKQRLRRLPVPRQQVPGRPQPVPPPPENRQKAPHRLLQQPQRRLAKPLNRPAQQRGLHPQRRHPKRTRKPRKPVQNPQKWQLHRPPVRRRHRHHLRLLQKMRRADRHQQRKAAPRQHPRRRQRQLAVRRRHLRAKLLLNPLRPVRKLLLIVLKRLPVQLRWKTQALQLKVL